MKAVIVNTCNDWKAYNSFNLVGVFTNRKKLIRCLNKMERKNKIVNKTNYKIPDMTIMEMHSNLNYVSLREINLNSEEEL